MRATYTLRASAMLLRRLRDEPRPLGHRDVHHLQPVGVGDERVAELHGDGRGPIDRRRRDLRRDRRLQRIGEIDDHEPAIAQHVGVVAGDRQVLRAVAGALPD